MGSIRKVLIYIFIPVLFLGSLYSTAKKYSVNWEIRFIYPWKHSLFPHEFAPPTFYWSDKSQIAHVWDISINLAGHHPFVTKTVYQNRWKPDLSMWDSIKTFSNYKDIKIVISRKKSSKIAFLDQKAELPFRISEDEVGAPILYREIPLPFIYAEKHIWETSYALYNVGSSNPRHEALGQFMVCGNCHSSTRDGKTIGLDFDAVSRDKGGYFIANVDSQVVFNNDNYMSWSKIEGKATFGLFSKISHQGRYVLTTIKDRVINVKFDAPSAIAYSELFFPINGVIAIYDRTTKRIAELPGANDTAYIQSNGIWTPDDKYIIFARAKALPYPDKSSRYESLISDTTITNAFVSRKRDLKFDLYIIPFNDGKGGEAKPIEGASFNGQSNYFPAISPDNKWLIFCESNNYMMIQPDSKLFIVPREGGRAIKLACNFPGMNSWHAWSPNGKWMVFVSKSLNIYTDMFLTHIDNKGHASIPVLLEDSKRPRCAANYPEFINRDPSFTFDMKYEYINTLLIQAAIHEGKIEQARKMVKQYLEQGQTSTPVEYEDLGNIMLKLGDKKEAEKYFKLEAQGDSSFYSRF